VKARNELDKANKAKAEQKEKDRKNKNTEQKLKQNQKIREKVASNQNEAIKKHDAKHGAGSHSKAQKETERRQNEAREALHQTTDDKTEHKLKVDASRNKALRKQGLDPSKVDKDSDAYKKADLAAKKKNQANRLTRMYRGVTGGYQANKQLAAAKKMAPGPAKNAAIRQAQQNQNAAAAERVSATAVTKKQKVAAAAKALQRTDDIANEHKKADAKFDSAATNQLQQTDPQFFAPH